MHTIGLPETETDSSIQKNDELFYLQERIRRHKFTDPNILRMSMDFGLIWLQAILGVALFITIPHTATLIISLILIGSAQHGLGLVAHEGAHYLILPSNRARNDTITRWLFASPIMLPFSLYRRRHLLHHRFVSTSRDTKEFYKRDIRGFRAVIELIRSISGLDYILQVKSALYRDKGDKLEIQDELTTKPQQIPSRFFQVDWVRKDLLPILIMQLGLIMAFSEFDIRFYILLWLVPNITVSMLVSKARSIVEHYPLTTQAFSAPGSIYFRETATPCLRSVEACFLERLLFSKINFHFHAEHHAWPYLSYQMLPKVHALLVETQKTRKFSAFQFGEGYLIILGKLVAGR